MKEFTVSWMTRINPRLILKLWRKKGCPGKVTVNIFGVNITTIRCPFGDLSYISKTNNDFKPVR